jgi:myosin heavy subunit
MLTVEILLLDDDLDSYRYLKSSRKSVQGVNDVNDFSTLKVNTFQAMLMIECVENHGTAE